MHKEPFGLILGAAVLGGLIGAVVTQGLTARPVSAQAAPPGKIVQAEKFGFFDSCREDHKILWCGLGLAMKQRSERTATRRG